jgi:hypothetical protein
MKSVMLLIILLGIKKEMVSSASKMGLAKKENSFLS